MEGRVVPGVPEGLNWTKVGLKVTRNESSKSP